MKSIPLMMTTLAISLIAGLGLAQVASMAPVSPQQELLTKSQATALEMRKLIPLLADHMKKLEVDLEAARAQLEKSKQIDRESNDGKGEVAKKEADLAFIQESIANAKYQTIQARMFLSLTKSISLQGKKVRIQDLKVLLTIPESEVMVPVRVARTQPEPDFRVTIDQRVPAEMTFDCDFKDVPLGTVIETIAQKTGLSLSMERDGSLRLVPSESGHTFDYPWPWVGLQAVEGLQYGHTIYPALAIGERWIYLASVLKNVNSARTVDESREPITKLSFAAPVAMDSLKTVTADLAKALPMSPNPSQVIGLGSDLLVIVEPGVDAKGAHGMWLTLYRCKSGQLIFLNQTFYVRKADGTVIPNSEILKAVNAQRSAGQASPAQKAKKADTTKPKK